MSYETDNLFSLQVVGRRTEIKELDSWGKRKTKTRIVVIASSIDEEVLKDKFDACLND